MTRNRKKIGLALSGGAARGYAHLGVLRVLEEEGIPIDFIAGTSAGSFAGGAYASGLSIEQIKEIAQDISWYRVSGLNFSAKGLISNKPIANIIKNQFPTNRFEQLRVPFAAVATNLQTGKKKVFKKEGDLGFAICASCAIPGIFAPLIDEDGNQFVDGGVVANLPVNTVREMGAEIVIASDVISCGSSSWGSPNTIVGILFQSAMMLLRTTSVSQHSLADVVVLPKLENLRPDELGKLDEFIEIGEEAARSKIDEIKKLIA